MLKALLVKRIQDIESKGYILENWDERRECVYFYFSSPENRQIIIHIFVFKMSNNIEFVVSMENPQHDISKHQLFIEQTLRIFTEQIISSPVFRLPFITGKLKIKRKFTKPPL